MKLARRPAKPLKGYEGAGPAANEPEPGAERSERSRENYGRYLLGWKEYFGLAETPRVFRGLDEWIRHRLRAIHLKQWKRGRNHL